MKRLVHIAFIAYVLVDALFLRDILFEATLPITRALQANYGTPSFIAFNRFMAGLLNPDMCAILSIFQFCVTPNKYRALKQMLFQCISLYALIFYKIIMGDPRPYFVDSQIKGWECYADFGNPSGHSTSVWMFYGIILTEICNDLTKRQTKNWQRQLTKSISVIIFIFLQVGIVFCRIFLGVHSINQVMIGTVFGIYVYFLYRNYTDDMMEQLFDYIRSYTRSTLTKVAIFTIAFAVSIQLPVYLYEIYQKEVPEIWKQNTFVHCPHFEDHHMFYKVCFKGCSTIAIVFGTLYAILLNKSTKQTMLIQFKSEKYERAYKVVDLKNFGKSIVGILIVVVSYILFYIVAPLHKFIPSMDLVYSKYYSLATGSFIGIFFLCLAVPHLYQENITEKASTKKNPENHQKNKKKN